MVKQINQNGWKFVIAEASIFQYCLQISSKASTQICYYGSSLGNFEISWSDKIFKMPIIVVHKKTIINKKGFFDSNFYCKAEEWRKEGVGVKNVWLKYNSWGSK